MLKGYLCTVVLALILSLMANYKWHKSIKLDGNFLMPAILSVIPVINIFWALISIVTVFSTNDMLNEAVKKANKED